ncbi:PH domain-containing protein [Microbulbifer magnicolonia]|uniref:PH domain-containing protein n=1 Tax=Microbulbifer magnicolonia TaxID=3109744 RepID=UPI002B405C68|nr:PH domain-containing protein [Microbulbifer sp. GG15]
MSALLLLGIPLLLMGKAPEGHAGLYSVAILLPPAILVLSALFAIRGYGVEDCTLLILRPGWKTRIPLQDLAEVKVDPEAMRASIRLFGNGGLFGIIGLFRNERLGRYRAFATDSARAVVLRFPARTLVVTPDRPEQFAAAVHRAVANVSPGDAG